MPFIEKQVKGKKEYYYLTKTSRTGAGFKKERVRLSGPNPSKAELREKSQQLRKPFSVQRISDSRIPNKKMIWERPCYPFLVWCAAEALVAPQKEEFGHSWGHTQGFFQNGMVKYVWDRKHMIKSGIHIINNLLEEEYFKTKKKRHDDALQRLKRTYKRFPELARLSDRELCKEQLAFYATFMEWWGKSQVAECIALGAEYLLGAEVDENTVSIITTPSEKSYSTIEEEELLAIADEIMKDQRLRSMFEKETVTLKSFPALRTRLERHVQDYYWLQNNYATITYCDIQYFIQEIKKILAQKKAPRKIIQDMNSRLDRIRKEKKEMIAKLDLPDEYLGLLRLVDYYSALQDMRKAISIEGNYYTYRFIEELSRRTGINSNLLLFISPFEYADILKGSFDVSELTRRKTGCVMIITERFVHMHTGEKYENAYKKIRGPETSEITEFEGKRAEGGTVTGRAKIVLDPRNAPAFKDGDILVTTMTSPDFLTFMKKSKAIITDEGGITCHAAIISRELGIPCIIGTKIATEVLKDNDFIEVNANHGLVRIVSRA